ncbi:hypothetical protein B296_00028814 [Ensete ventricosum]|uniref:Uncharacterized protein n=1 Tax=Ensete ventricosum TaxID=4639 RepID=A0A426YHN6_ENSVE|nr:hypothetical protein B296_00028814 [Ensete ventricosum]
MMVVPSEWGAPRSRSIAARKKSFWIEIEARRGEKAIYEEMKPLPQANRRARNHVLITWVRSPGPLPRRPASPSLSDQQVSLYPQ